MTDQNEEIQKRFFPDFISNQRRSNQAEATLAFKPSIFCPEGPVPYAGVPLVDRELKHPEEMKVITAVTYSQWAAPHCGC